MYIRNCPDCKREIPYKTEGSMLRSTSKNTICRKCVQKSKRKINPNKHLTKKEENTIIIRKHAEGLNNPEIGKCVGLSGNSIRCRLAKLGLKSNRERGKPPIPVDEFNSICSKCGEITPNLDFALLRSYEDGRRLSQCRKCRCKQNNKAIYASEEVFFRTKQSRLRAYAKRKKIPVNLPDMWLYNIWIEQNKKCFYTGKILDYNAFDLHEAISVDKVEPSKGYIVENVVLCTNRINSIKRDVSLEEMKEYMPGWHKKVLSWKKEKGYV